MARAYRTTRALLTRFLRDRGGNVAIIAGFAMVVLILIAGAGIDFGRAYNMRTAIERALDSATLAGARQLSTSMATTEQVTATVSDFFNANMELAGYKDVTVGDVSVNINKDAGTLDVTASAKIPTTFISLSGIKTLTVAAFSESTFSHYDVEVAMVVDVTGSMQMSGSMPGLRSASQSLVDILIPSGTQTTEAKVRISLVPFSQGVNAGSYAATVSNGQAGSRNCVTERDGDQKYTDAAYDYAGVDSIYFGGGSNVRYNSYYKTVSGSDNCSTGSKLIPLTSNRETLTGAISALTANGGTGGQTGIAWGWYTLSPNWSNLWPADSAPGAYNNEDLLKFAVVMTDGDFNAFYDRYDVESCSGGLWSKTCTVTKKWAETYLNYATDDDQPSVRARNFCAAMKLKGITVYGIYFGSDGSSAGSKVMSYCATSGSTYYQASDSSALIAAFQKIANEIQSIYLSR